MKLNTYFRLLFFMFSLGSIITQNMEQSASVSTSEDMEQTILAPISDNIEQSTQALSLNQFNFAAASVLPTYKNTEGQTIVVLSREAYGRDKGTYDDFGGKRDSGEKHPETTAAREGWEELILGKTGPISLRSFRQYINVDSAHTQYIVARKSKRSVVYISDFTSYWDNIRKTFYSARFNAKQRAYKEKDHLVVVLWDDLQNVIVQSQPKQKVTMEACSINQNGEYDTESMVITLRPFLVDKLKPFFQNQSFEQGKNKKIRFYE